MTEIGIVDSVDVDEDRRRVLLTVFLSPGRTEREVPFRTQMQGMWAVPEIGQLVEVYEAAPGRKAARFPHSPSEFSMPSGLEPGDYALKTADGTFILIKADGTLTVESENTMNVRSNTGSVIINDGSEGAIYDITTQKDADGHVTDITLERRSNILI